MITSYYKSRI